MAKSQEFNPEEMKNSAAKASALMKTLGHQGRLLVLCQLVAGEKSVGELSRLLGIEQSPLSQHLSRMRREGLVTPRRSAQTIYYSLSSAEVSEIIRCIYQIYCAHRTVPTGSLHQPTSPEQA